MSDVFKLLAGYPILQWTFAACIVMITVWGIYRAERKRDALPPSAQMPHGMQMFFQGPVIQALEKLANIEALLVRAEQRELVRMQVLDEIEAQHRQRESSRWHDMFELVRGCRGLLERLVPVRRSR